MVAAWKKCFDLTQIQSWGPMHMSPVFYCAANMPGDMQV
jgi:hypothetical protein